MIVIFFTKLLCCDCNWTRGKNGKKKYELRTNNKWTKELDSKRSNMKTMMKILQWYVGYNEDGDDIESCGARAHWIYTFQSWEAWIDLAKETLVSFSTRHYQWCGIPKRNSLIGKLLTSNWIRRVGSRTATVLKVSQFQLWFIQDCAALREVFLP